MALDENQTLQDGSMSTILPDHRFGLDVIYRPANPPETPDSHAEPLHRDSRILPQGYVHQPDAMPLPCAIRQDRDAVVKLTSGADIYVDIYRPVDSRPVPAILVWSPYGKTGGWWTVNLPPAKFGVPANAVSGLQCFEAPDPAFWVNRGYAVVIADAPGSMQSGGDMLWWGAAGAADSHDMVEWIAVQDWCTGKVGMSGNSQLAIMQWFTAAVRPPHLTAIAPWEGLIDMYRDNLAQGGIPDPLFQRDEIYPRLYGLNRMEDPSAMIERYPLMNDYWADKRVQLSAIDIPAYVVASYTNPLHARGTLEAFNGIASQEKWLRIHNSMEWPDLYDPRNVEDLAHFFDHFLKGEENGWEETPKVRMSVLDPGGTDEIGRIETAWPPERAVAQTFFLDAAQRTFTTTPAAESASADYLSSDIQQSLVFEFSVDEEMELLGSSRLRLWVESDGADDMDLFVQLYKTSADGHKRYHICVPGEEAQTGIRHLERDGRLPAMLSYAGPEGRLRVSHRALDETISGPLQPHHRHDREERLVPGDIVPVDIAIWPTALKIHCGETLRLEIAGLPLGGYALPGMPGGFNIPTRNTGRHIIHTGGQYPSCLVMALVPANRGVDA